MKPHIKYLTDLGACSEGIAFAERHPDLQTAWRACTRLDWLQWIVTAPAEAEYERVIAQAQAEYKRVTAPALAEYWRVRDQAEAEYRRVRDQAWAEYERVRAPALACKTCDKLRAAFKCPDVS